MTVPYYAFTDAGMVVDVASIKGGAIPIEPQSLRWPVASPADRRFLRDADARSKVERSLAIDDVDASSYDVVFLAGGWGAAYDLGQSAALGGKVSEVYASDAIVGGVCHGPLGLLQATTPAGEPLVQGRRIATCPRSMAAASWPRTFPRATHRVAAMPTFRCRFSRIAPNRSWQALTTYGGCG